MILLPHDYWEIKKVPKKGKGLFAKKDIEAGTVIGDYLGLVIRAEAEDEYDKEDHFYLMYYHDKASIYPDVKKPGIHIINYSCTPNVWMYTYKGHALYFALRHIFAGEELNVNYLLEPQDNSCSPCTHLCHCGSVICTGTMHMTAEKYDAWDELNHEISKRTKTDRVFYGKNLPQLSTYPESIEDHPLYTLFGNEKVKPKICDETSLPSIEKIREYIRTSGQTLLYQKLYLHIIGVMDGVIISKRIE